MFRNLRFALRRFPVLHRMVMVFKAAVLKAKSLGIELVRRLPGPANFGLPRGFYSDLELLQAHPPRIEGGIVLLDQGPLSAEPDSLLALCGRGQHLNQPWPVFWTHRCNAELVGPSLVHVDARGRLCREAAYSRYAEGDPSYFYRRRGCQPVHLQGNWTSIVSRWMPTDESKAFGHWLLDVLPRLAVLKEFPSDTRIIVPHHRAAYQVESLTMLGVVDRCRWTAEQDLRIENYYFSAPTSMIGCYNPHAIHWIREAFLPVVKDDTRPTPARFFVRRVGNVRNMVNEAEVLAFFRDIGWEIVNPGELRFADQIRYFSRAEAVCGIHGSAFNNTLWCQPGTPQIELFASSYPASESEWIARCLPPSNYHHLIFPTDHRLNAIVDLDQLRQKLRGLGLL
jgi:hypothetical protein